MNTPNDVIHAYCTRCGAPTVDGACSASCMLPAVPSSSTPPSPRVQPARSDRRRGGAFWVLTLVALLVALSLGGVAGALLASMQARLQETTSSLQNTRDQVASLEQRLQAAQSEQRSAVERLTVLEATVNDQPDIPRTARTASKSVFTIGVGGGSGSGFAVAHEGGGTVLVTNFHVVSRTYVNGGREVAVRRAGSSYDGTIVDASESNDLAFISVPQRLPVLDLVERRPAIGEPVLVLGSPLGLGGTVTSGIVSAFRTEDGLDYLQFSAPISPGNSGGPVVNTQGEVVGVAVAKLVGPGAEGLGFAVPTTRLCTVLDVC